MYGLRDVYTASCQQHTAHSHYRAVIGASSAVATERWSAEHGDGRSPLDCAHSQLCWRTHAYAHIVATVVPERTQQHCSSRGSRLSHECSMCERVRAPVCARTFARTQVYMRSPTSTHPHTHARTHLAAHASAHARKRTRTHVVRSWRVRGPRKKQHLCMLTGAAVATAAEMMHAVYQ